MWFQLGYIRSIYGSVKTEESILFSHEEKGILKSRTKLNGFRKDWQIQTEISAQYLELVQDLLSPEEGFWQTDGSLILQT